MDRLTLSRPALAGAAVAFFLMGGLAAGFGPLVPLVTRRFGIGLSEAGLLFSAFSIGGLLANLIGMRALERVAARAAMATGLVLLAAGAAGIALAPTWPLFLAGTAVSGAGFGALDIGVNQFIAHGASAHRAALQNAINGAYGLGAVAGPPLVAWAGLSRLSLVYGGLALAALLPLLSLGGVRGGLGAPAEAGLAGLGWSRQIGFFVLAFVLYVGLELATGGWIPTHLGRLGFAPLQAATVTSGFWLTFAIGRLLVAPLTLAVSEAPLVLGGGVAAVLALLLAMSGRLAPVAYLLVGFAIAPIWPTAVVWLAKLNPGNPRATAWLFPASGVGGALVPAGVGAAISAAGVIWTPLVLAAIAVASLAAFLAASAVSRGRSEAFDLR